MIATIGKESEADDRMMVPNQNFLTYFPEVELPEQRYNPERSGCIRIGAFIVIRKIIEEYRMPDMLDIYFTPKGRDVSYIDEVPKRKRGRKPKG